MTTALKSSLIGLGILTLIGCSSQPTQEQIQAEPAEESQGPQDIWGWDYSGERGPEAWGTLNPKYKTCREGQEQSPINLVWQKPTSKRPLKVNYRQGQATIINAGYTFRLELTAQSSIEFRGQHYTLEKIEFRTPSEHTLSDKSQAMEIQFYHRSSNGLKQVVMAALASIGAESDWLNMLIQASSTQPKFQSSNSFTFDPSQLVPDRLTFYQYSGSLTHPPCLEGVQWVVLNTPVQISAKQLEQIQSMFGSNNRPVQPLNNRKVTNY